MKTSHLLLTILLLILCSRGHAADDALALPEDRSAAKAGLQPREVADRVAARFLKQDKFPVNYTHDITLEALLVMFDVTGDKQYLQAVESVMEKRKMPPGFVHSFRSQPFCCISFELYLRTHDERYVAPFLAECRKYQKEVPRAFDGAVTHYGDPKMGRILIDQLQDYSSRMAKAGWLSGEGAFFKEAVGQYGLFRAALRDSKTGLWGHGRGWFQDAKHVTTTPWGRGHAWLLRGMVETLTYLPPDGDEARQMRQWLDEFAKTLLKHQDEQGMWHQVVDRPDSYAETSATAGTVYYLARAVRQGYLPKEPYQKAAIKGYDALLKRCIAADGTIYHTCRGTPPLATLDEYLKRESPVNDPHGVAMVILASAGRLLLDGQGTLPHARPKP